MGDAYRLGGEGGIQPITDTNHKWKVADDLVEFWDPIERAGAFRSLLQLSDAGTSPSERRQKLTRVVTRGGKTRMQQRQRARSLGGGDKAERDRGGGDRLGQHAVARWWLNELCRECL